ncbi:glycosyltransferase [Pseudomonas otitidis]|jgi:glycosyltransferase Alg8|uniref:glycosyltransferase n=1 Tax=Pseudomonadaceae TaxID=135621 RepID=UPI0005CA5F77|nr:MULTISPECIES: glycosyltransferase [Pseudomonas]KIV72405.1 Alginate biosynthesis protein Alg8 [Pseudomonas sp. FeS53a]MBO2927854.1 glycosyltransferase [Pseudomonas otitidis]MCO7555590.1 glycosyltransferase family 2 protein [Pseudomonas otitidis]MDI6525055.1 glycosyltransferase [Pseudomonas otitidis]MDU9395151.1 glycosyltransferase [Pseudomonas sp. zfem003]
MHASDAASCGRLRKLIGWTCLFALVALASEMVAPEYLDPAHHKFIFIIGAIGIWRYSNAAIHFLRGMYFLHWKFPRMRKQVEAMGDEALPDHLFMVVTSFRIPTTTTFKVYRSVFQEVQRLGVPCTVIASIVEKGDENFIKAIMRDEVRERSDIRLIIVRARGTGKRDGLAHAFRALSRQMPLQNSVVGVVDGDTIMLPGCVERAVKMFALLPSVGGLTTNEYCEVEGGKLVKEWHTMRFVQRHINMCSMALSRRVLTLTGRLSFFRASVMTDPEFIRDVEADFLEHWRLGRFQFLTGDDKSSWFSLMRAGWDTFYVPDSHTLTVEHPPDSNFFRATRQLMFRWYGNSLRQNFRATSLLGWERLGAFTLYVLYDQRLSMWTCLMGLTASVAAALLFGVQYLLVYLFWVLLSRTLVTLLFHFSGHPVDALYPFVLYYNQIVGSIMKVYALFHMDQQSWTRQKTTLSNRGVSFDVRLNRWSSKAMMFSSIAIFLGVVSVLLELTQI